MLFIIFVCNFITQYNFTDTTCKYYAEPIHQVIMLALNAAVLAAYFPAQVSWCIRVSFIVFELRKILIL